jgi:hypothetical protein
VSQISPPIRIVLVAAVALVGAWMLFLRPKTDTVTPTPNAPVTAPGVKGLTNDIAKAKGASKTSDAANAKIQSATGGSTIGSTAGTDSASKSSSSTSQAATGSTAATAGLPVRVQKALDAKKVLVLFFYNPKSADDRAVRDAVKHVDRWDGDVVIQSADVSTVARYSKIARGADVEQSPTVVVVDKNRQAETLVGYQDTRSIDQAVVDAIRNSGGVLIKDPYLSKINDVCRESGQAIWNVPDPAHTGAELRTSVRSYDTRVQHLVTRFKAVPAPAKSRAFRRASVSELGVLAAYSHGLVRATGNGKQLAPIARYVRAETPGVNTAAKTWNARMDKRRVLSCGSNF